MADIISDVKESAKKSLSKEIGMKVLGATIGAIIVLGISEVFKDRPSYTGMVPIIGHRLVGAGGSDVVPAADETTQGGDY